MKVDAKRYKLFDYHPYYVMDKPVDEKPKDSQYDVGDVVYIKPTNSIGVVLGCIDPVREDLRTDADGMQCYCDIRPATMEDFNIKDVFYTNALLGELQRQSLQQDRWERDDIQFPRLLSEILATQELDLVSLSESMDLDEDRIKELLDRAQERFESIKNTIL